MVNHMTQIDLRLDQDNDWEWDAIVAGTCALKYQLFGEFAADSAPRL